MALGAIPILAWEFRVYLGFAGVLCATAMLWFFMQDAAAYVMIATLIGVFFGALFATARNYAQSLTRGLILAETNARLHSNLTRAQEREASLHNDRTRLRDFAELGAEVFWETDSGLRYCFMSDRCEEIMGVSPDALIGFELGRPEELFVTGGEEVRAAAGARNVFTARTLSGARPDGRPFTVLCSGKPVFDVDGHFQGYRGTLHDVTAQQSLARRLTYQATHDSLTGLINRREFEARLNRALANARQLGSRHALLYLDLDQFKVINDTGGHAAGDLMLRQIAGVIRSRLRARDSLARIGGDEFGVLMEQCPLDAAMTVAESVRRAIEEFRFDWADTKFSLGISIGMVELTERSSGDAAQWMSAADSACYAAKDAGRNRVQLFDSDDVRINQRQVETRWLNQISRALREDAFELAAQPIVSVAELPVSKLSWPFAECELLLRFPDANGGETLPRTIFPTVERFNLAPRLDRWVIRQALTWLSSPEVRGRVRSCGINLSGKSLSDPDFSRYVIEKLESAKVPAQVLCLEITETGAVENIDAALRFMRTMRQRGCRFALDDFGIGFSSFAYLKNLPADYLKIDGLFIQGLLTDPTDRALVGAIHSLGRIFGMKTVAEFVDKPALFGALRDIGIDYAQGFEVGVPVPIRQRG
jgi:diguanylate cyclase (GGDEF)-like protein/PAS domain S-box-containing protein